MKKKLVKEMVSLIKKIIRTYTEVHRGFTEGHRDSFLCILRASLQTSVTVLIFY
jgi:hypothetical protein